jgi:hypothetical protein
MRRVSCASTRAVSSSRVFSFARSIASFVEHHALDGHLGLQHLQEVPRDGLALAVLISCEVELVGTGQRLLQIGDRLLLRVGDDVVGLEAVLDVDGELSERALLELRREVLRLDEVADVANRGLDDVSISQVLGNGLRLGGRLDDNELFRARHVTPL